MARICICSLTLLLLLAGCQFHSPAEDLLDDYLTRLARVLNQPKPEVARRSPPRLPAPRDLQVAIEPLSIDLLDYWAFRKCGLTPLLSERNSILGRVMQPSQALHMDGRLLRQLAHCQQELVDEELLVLTRGLIEEKQAQWPARYWNATVAAPEMQRFWSPSTEPLAPGAEESYHSAEAALRFLTALPQRLGTQDWPTSSTLELHYQQLESYELGGKLLQSLQLANDYFRSANQLLETAIEESVLCPYQLERRELTYARNVMAKVFVGKVQPWFAALNRRASSLLDHYDQLVRAQAEELQPRIRAHQESVDSLFDDFQQLNQQHVQHWQTLFENCNSEAVNR